MANNGSNVDVIPPSAKRRLFPIFRSGASNVCETQLAGDASAIEPKPTDDLALFTLESARPNPFNEGTRSISDTTVQIHATPDADHACQDQTDRGENHKGTLEMATLQQDLLIQDHLKTAGTKLQQKAKENIHKKPWQTPSHEDFLPAGTSARASSKHSSSIPAIPVRGSLRSLSTVNVFAPLPTKASSGGAETCALNACKRVRSCSDRGTSFEELISTTPTTTLDEDDQEQIGTSPCNDISPLKLVGVKRGERSSVPKSTRSSIPAPKTRQPIGESPSPDVSPRIWLRRYGRFGSSSQWFLPRELTPVRSADDPSWKIQGNKLEIFVANGTSRDTYAVEIEASIRLSELDDEGWLEFIIPGLPRPENPCLSGSVDFRIMPSARQSSIDVAMDETKYQFEGTSIVEAQFDTRSLHKEQIGLAHVFGRFWPHNSKLLRTRLKSSIYNIVSWDASILTHTTPTWSKSQGVQLRHHTRLQMKQPKRDIFADLVGFSFYIKNGPLCSQEYILKASRCSVHIEEDVGQQNGPATNKSAKVTIYREIEDLGLPLDIYFMSKYAQKDQATVALPTLCPTVGKVLSESILLTKPSSPLVIEHVERAFFSSWKKADVTEGSCCILRFDRVDLPQLFPDGLKDDVIVRIGELCPVQFSALETSEDSFVPVETSSPVWNLDIQIDRVCGQNLVCRMSLIVEVGNDSERLLAFHAHKWVPELSFIDGRLATQTAGEWRETEDGYLTLLKSPSMISGQIVRVEMRWKELIVPGEFKGDGVAMSNVEYYLPTIIGRSVLGGSLTCNDDNVMLSLDDGEADGMDFHFFKSYARNQTKLPKLLQGYSMQLSFHQMLPRSPRIVRFADEFKCCSETSSNIPSTLGHTDTSIPSEDACNVSERCHPLIITSSAERHETLPLWRLPLRLAGVGFRCLVIPFLLVSAAQLLVAHVGHRLIPSSIENLFSAILGSNADPGSRANCDLGYPLPHPSDAGPHLGTSAPYGAAMSNPAASETTTGGLHKQRPNGKTQAGVSAVAAGTPEQELRFAGGGLIDWIDRALGWKDIRL